MQNTADFNSELLKMLCEDDDKNDDNICLISGVALEDNYVTLCCGHKFNYLAIYNEILNQKTVENYKEVQHLKKKELKCPYCRTIQQGLLPFYSNYPSVEKIEGVNWPIKLQYKTNSCKYIYKSGKKKGLACGIKCTGDYCNKCNKIMIRRKEKEELIKQKQKQKQKNIVKDKYTETVVINPIQNAKINVTIKKNLCQYIFKKGKHKGSICGCSVYGNTSYCLKHYNYLKKKNTNKSKTKTNKKIPKKQSKITKYMTSNVESQYFFN